MLARPLAFATVCNQSSKFIMNNTKILVADDHSLVRYGLCSILNSEDNFDVVAEASTGREAMALFKEHKPELCFLDITMPDKSGIEACKEMLQIRPDTKVIIMTIHLTEEYLNQVLGAGAQGYLLKSASREDIIASAHKVLKGQRVFSEDVSELMTQSFLNKKEESSDENLFSRLTPRENEILSHIIDGKTNQVIAKHLYISPRTVETHRANLMHKLGVKNTAALVRKAIKVRLLQ